MRKSYALERLDTGEYTQEEYEQCLEKLGEIGSKLSGDRAGFAAFDKLTSPPTSILDVGCGGGYFTTLLAKRYPNAEVVGIDLSREAIAFAKRKQPNLPHLRFAEQKEKSLAGMDPVDVVTATLVCHHMNDEELVAFLQEAKGLAKQAVLLNDLHRSYVTYLLFALISPRFQSRLIREDGLHSVRRAFTKKEWESYLKEAGFARYEVEWKRGFRYIACGFCGQL